MYVTINSKRGNQTLTPFLKKFLICIALIGGIAFSANAQPEFPALQGDVADGTGQLDISEVQAAINRLKLSTSAKPIALAYDNKGGLTSDEFEMQFLEHNRLASSEAGVDPDLVLIAIDYEDSDLRIFYGDGFKQELDSKFERILDVAIIPSARSDPTRAFVDGFDEIGKALLQRNQTTWMGWGSILLWLSPVFIVLLIWFLKKAVPAYRLRKPLIQQIKKFRLENSKANASLKQRLPADQSQHTAMAYLLPIYKVELQEQAASWTQAYQQQLEAVASIQEQNKKFDEKPVHLMVEEHKLRWLVDGYKRLEDAREKINRWLADLHEEQTELQAKVNQVAQDVKNTKAQLNRLNNEYGAIQRQSKHLPPFEQIEFDINKKLKRIDGWVEGNYLLRASEAVSRLQDHMERLKEAAQALLHAEQKWSTFHDDVQPGRQEIVSADVIQKAVDKKLADIAFLFEKEDYELVRDQSRALHDAHPEVIGLLSKFSIFLDDHDLRVQQIKAIESQGYRMVAQDSLEQVERSKQEANKALVAADFVAAENWIDELELTSKAALDQMQGLETLRLQNEDRLKVLAHNVAAADQQRRNVYEPVWRQMQEAFHEENWDEVAENFDQATAFIEALFDDPKDEHDLASEVARLNNLEHQAFEQAEQLLSGGEADLEKARILLNQIQVHNDKILHAKEVYQTVLEKAQKALQQAIKSRDESDRLVSPDVDDMLNDAQAALGEARRAADEHIYLDVLGFCQDVQSLCDEANAEVKQQVAEINIIVEKKEEAKFEARLALDNLEDAIESAPKPAILKSTYNKFEQATSALREASRHEAKALALEDKAMLNACRQSFEAYQKVQQLAVDAFEAFIDNQTEYQMLLKKAQSTYHRAKKAIEEAERRCKSYRARGAGKSQLSVAASRLRGIPVEGATREEIQRAHHAAAEAERLARKAEKLAEQAIEVYRAREHREREAYERRRYRSSWYDDDDGDSWWTASPDDWSYRSRSRSSWGWGSSSSSSRSSSSRSSSSRSYSSGRSTSRRSFGGGRSTSRRKF